MITVKKFNILTVRCEQHTQRKINFKRRYFTIMNILDPESYLQNISTLRKRGIWGLSWEKDKSRFLLYCVIFYDVLSLFSSHTVLWPVISLTCCYRIKFTRALFSA